MRLKVFFLCDCLYIAASLLTVLLFFLLYFPALYSTSRAQRFLFSFFADGRFVKLFFFTSSYFFNHNILRFATGWNRRLNAFFL